jgi:hypothetical protein
MNYEFGLIFGRLSDGVLDYRFDDLRKFIFGISVNRPNDFLLILC